MLSELRTSYGLSLAQPSRKFGSVRHVNDYRIPLHPVFVLAFTDNRRMNDKQRFYHFASIGKFSQCV